MKTKSYTMLLIMLVGWINRQQQEMINYLKEENTILRSAFELLGYIETLRIEYGKPLLEGRHPDITSIMMPWPPFDVIGW